MAATVLGDQYVTIGVGTTAQRPASPVQGMIRYNTTLSSTEIYNGSNWVPISISAYNVLTIDSSGNLIHNQILGTDGNTTLSSSPENAVSAFFSNTLAIGIYTSGNLTATY